MYFCWCSESEIIVIIIIIIIIIMMMMMIMIMVLCGWRSGESARAPSTNVARLRLPVPVSYVGWVCCWFSSLPREVFLRVLWFFNSLSSKTNTSKFQLDLEQPSTQAFSSRSTRLGAKCRDVTEWGPRRIRSRGMPFGDVTKFRAKSWREKRTPGY